MKETGFCFCDDLGPGKILHLYHPALNLRAIVVVDNVAAGPAIGVTDEAEAMLHQRGVLCLPDFISNAGGVICAAVEYHGGTQSQALETIRERIRTNTAEVLERWKHEGILPRQAAVAMAADRVRAAMRFRR